MKLLRLDIETSPHTAFVWGLFKETVPIQRLIATGRVMCFSYKWDKGKVVTFSEWEHGHEHMVHVLHSLLDEADGVIHYNGNRFDIPMSNSEFLKYGLHPPSPYQNIDLYRVSRSSFRLPSYKLDYIAQSLGIGSKTKHPGFEMWIDCMKGVPSAQKMMQRYNKQDIVLLDKLYKILLPWINKHPNSALYKDDLNRPLCTNCGSKNVQRRGEHKTKTMVYQRYHCQSCGKWMRSRKNVTEPSVKENTLVSVNV